MRRQIRETREKLLAAVHRTTAEVVSFEDFGEQLLPAVRRLFNSSGLHLYRSDAECPMVTLGGDAMTELSPPYLKQYVHEDPMQAAARRSLPWIFPFSRSPEWKAYVRRPVHDFFTRNGVKYLLHVRLADGVHYQPGMVALVLAKSLRQGDFTDDDTVTVAQLLPSLLAASRRCTQALGSLRTRRVLEALLEETQSHPMLVLDLSGRLLWMSERAASWLGGKKSGGSGVPEVLTAAAHKQAALVRGAGSSVPPPFEVTLRDGAGEPLLARLRLVRNAGDTPFVVIDLEKPGVDPSVSTVAERFGLTRAETKVLGFVASGLRDREIAERTFTSQHTVRTHIGRILSKLGVHSRLEALLLARGEQPRANQTTHRGEGSGHGEA